MFFQDKRWPKLTLLIIGFVMYFSNYTDADLIDIELIQDNLLRATTLDFSNKNTANEMPVSTLFNISGLIANGFDVETVRIKREGEMSFSYEITSENIIGNQDLCSSLVVIIMKDWEIVYEGAVSDIFYIDEVNAVRYQDLVFVLKTNGSGAGMGNQSCHFEFKIKTNLSEEDSSFFDEEILQNQVVSG